MGVGGDERSLSGVLSERLRELSGEIVAEWVEWIRQRISNPVVESLSTHGLLDHIPPVIDHLGVYLVNPTYAVREEMLSQLRLHGQIRRDQGFDLRDVMAELDGLSHLIMRRMHAELLSHAEDHSLDAALTIFGRLAAGLRALAFVALGVYRETEADRGQELARRLAEFGRTIGHELRSPLNAIALSADVLQDPAFFADDERRSQQLDIIRSGVKHAHGLLYDIDVLAMAESARTAPHMSPLPKVLESVRDELSARARSMDVTLEFDSSPPRLAVETVVAQLVLTNLINNAIKYSDPEKERRRVTIRAHEAGMEDSLFVMLEVSDNGIGIPEDFQSRVFQRHFRVHAEVAEGTGLGLAITQELVLERGGTIELESMEGEGTTIRAKIRALDADSIDAYKRGEGPEGLMRAAVREVLKSESKASADDTG